MQDGREDVPSSPSLAKLLKTETAHAAELRHRQQHFDSGGGLLDGCGGLLDGGGGGDSWGSISKMLHQRYNAGGGSSNGITGEEERRSAADDCRPGGRVRRRRGESRAERASRERV